MAVDDTMKDSQKIQESLINTFKKYAEKSIHDANYDKTILATVQYCADATIGQYKIKYQNGYFTAYSKDTTMQYSNGAVVYVLVPGNDMNNRMFITGLANNNSENRTYIRSLEGDQQYYAEGSNYITGTNGGVSLDMSSYWGINALYSKVLYFADDHSNDYLTINKRTNELLKTAKAIRVGADFKINDMTDYRKTSGDYGLKITFRYKKEGGEIYYKYFVLDTYHMVGSPFNFATFRPQYNYWDMDSSHSKEFDCLYKIEEYVTSFPERTPDDRHSDGYKDISVQNISLQTAVKLYNTDNDKYKVKITSEDNFIFDDKSSIPLHSELMVDGSPVNSKSGQNVQYYWAKEDISVNSTNHAKYNEYTGKGWYCLNASSKKKYEEGTSLDDLKKTSSYTILQSDSSIPNEYIVWDSTQQNINLNKNVCPGRYTRIKCVCYYDNTVISSDIKTVENDGGFYILINSLDDKVESYNSLGSFTLTAGIFRNERDQEENLHVVSYTLPEYPQSPDYKFEYIWEEVDSTGLEKSIPPIIDEELISQEEWDKNQDNETIADVEPYLREHPEFRLCKERYDYYTQKYNYYLDLEEPTPQQDGYREVCASRIVEIKDGKADELNSYYVDNYNNTMYYVFGPSNAEADFIDGEEHITSTTPYYYGTTEYENYQDYKNTLYSLPATKIGKRATYKVSVLYTFEIDNQEVTQSIGTESITLVNADGASLDYTIEITNGTQTFNYDEGGLAPNITIMPLYFKIFNASGELLFDSEAYGEYNDKPINLTTLKPRWIFYEKKYSLIQTKYQGTDNCSIMKIDQLNDDDGTYDGPISYALFKSHSFIYGLLDKYDLSKKENSNILLQVTIDDTVYAGATQFTFVKEGELGTNGMNMVLEIHDDTYDQYRNNVLAAYTFSTFYEKDCNQRKKRLYQPMQRNLFNTYLYATMAYDGSGNAKASTKAGNFVNLKFAQGGKEIDSDFEKGVAVVGNKTATLRGYWDGEGGRSVVNNIPSDNSNPKWSTLLETGSYKGKKYYLYPSFKIKSLATDKEATLEIQKKGQNAYGDYAYKPTQIKNVTISGTLYDYKVANNVVKLEASRNGRKNYGYYTMPYFYFNYTGETQMPEGFDPARHIIVVGGFNEVIYDSAGANPSYNKQEPFSFYMFNENNRDITAEVIAGIASGKTTITWSCSNSLVPVFNGLPPAPDSQDFPTYASYDGTTDLYGLYCKHGQTTGGLARYWKCNVHHKKSGKIVVKDDEGKVIKKYDFNENPNLFIKDYWEEIDVYQQHYQYYKLRPMGMYDTVAESDLFNSWVSLYVKYTKSSSKVYEAEVLLPINIICNKYGSEEINDWDGKTTVVDDAYMISSKVAAGVKNDDNTFTGITIGSNFYAENENYKTEVGLFGYGRVNDNDPNSWARTMFMDAKSGRIILGPTGGSQIVLDPGISQTEQIWSRLAGWYMSPDYLYKPIGEGNIPPSEYSSRFTNLAQGQKFQPPTTDKGSVGMYCPFGKDVDKDNIWLWADSVNKSTWRSHNKAQFYVTYGGKLYCQEAEIEGKINASSGQIGTDTNGLAINHTLADKTGVDRHYILYNKKFWVRDDSNAQNPETSLYLEGTIMANSGQFGTVGEDKNGENSSTTLFINYKWYPWRLPEDDEPWDDEHMYLDKTKPMITYPIYHKNFYIDRSGNGVFQGRIYSKRGRVGNWVIQPNQLKSSDGNIVLSPSGGLTVGSFHASVNGGLTGPNWYILPSGQASFSHAGNQFKGASFTTANGSYLGEGGLHLDEEEVMTIGSASLTATPAGFKFDGAASFENNVWFKKPLWVEDSLNLGTSGSFYLSSSGIHFGSQHQILAGGTANLGDTEVKSLMINGVTLKNFILDVIGNCAASFTYMNKPWDQVKGKLQSVTISTV